MFAQIRGYFRRCALGAWLAAGLLCLAGCEVSEPAPEHLVVSTLRPEFAPLLKDLPTLPFYDMEIWYQPERSQLKGRMRMAAVNHSADTWPQLIFRLYPNLYHYGGRLEIQGLTLDRRPLPFRLEADESVARVPLPQDLWIEPRHSFEVELRWTLALPVFQDVSSVNVRFGEMLGFHSAPLFYPALAPYLAGPEPGTGGWWTAAGPEQGDVIFSDASFFAVSLYMSSAYPPVTNGIAVSREELSHLCPLHPPWTECTPQLQEQCVDRLSEQACQAQALTRHDFVSGPAREFVFVTHADYQSDSFDADGVQVYSYWVPGMAESGRPARDYAVAALRLFTEEFGPYPYPVFSVAMAPLASGSMEYPQLSLIGVQLYQDFQRNLEDEIAFSVAHQWWSQLVHNDPVNEPWLDEALSSYAAYLYQERLYGPQQAEIYRLQKWGSPIQYVKDSGRDDPVSLPVRRYASGSDYRTLVYRKGAQFFQLLREDMGALQSRLTLTDFVSRHRFGLVNAQMLLDLLWQTNPSAMTLHQREYLDPALWR